MGKLKNIFEGYKNLIIEDKELEPLFQQRLDTCNNCPVDANKLGICTLCGCVIKAKTHSPLENCPAHLWKPTFYVDNDFEYVLKSEIPLNLQPYFKEEDIPLEDWLEFLENNDRSEEESK